MMQPFLDRRLAAVDALKTLRGITGETVHPAVPDGVSMIFIEKLESTSAVRMASRMEGGMPLSGAFAAAAWPRETRHPASGIRRQVDWRRYNTMQAAAPAPGRWGTRTCPAARDP